MFRGLALAFGLAVSLGGCLVAPGVSDDEIGEAESDLVAIDADGPADPGEAVEEGGEPQDPDPLPWRDAEEPGSSGDPNEAPGLWGVPEDPDPLPWHDGAVESGERGVGVQPTDRSP